MKRTQYMDMIYIASQPFKLDFISFSYLFCNFHNALGLTLSLKSEFPILYRKNDMIMGIVCTMVRTDYIHLSTLNENLRFSNFPFSHRPRGKPRGITSSLSNNFSNICILQSFKREPIGSNANGADLRIVINFIFRINGLSTFILPRSEIVK